MDLFLFFFVFFLFFFIIVLFEICLNIWIFFGFFYLLFLSKLLRLLLLLPRLLLGTKNCQKIVQNSILCCFGQFLAQCTMHNAQCVLSPARIDTTAWQHDVQRPQIPVGIQSFSSRRNSSSWDKIIQPQKKCVLYKYSKIKNTTPNNLLKLSNSD